MSTPTHPRKLLTIITEAALERELIRELDQLKVGGYTITDARGRGHQGARSSSWDQNANIRVEVICDPARALELAQHLRHRYFAHYAMVLTLSDVEVLRPDKFGR